MMYLLLDLLVVAVLVICALRGAAKGLVLSLCGLLAVAVAFLGASFASRALSPMVAQALEPRFAAAIEEKLEAEIHAAQDGDTPVSTGDLPLQDALNALKEMGFYQGLIDTVDRAVEDGMLDVAAGAAAVWTALSRSLDLVARLPGLHFLNKTGGAVIGVVKGCALLFVAVWLMQYLGHIIPEEAVGRTHLLRYFLLFNPLELLL